MPDFLRGKPKDMSMWERPDLDAYFEDFLVVQSLKSAPETMFPTDCPKWQRLMRVFGVSWAVHKQVVARENSRCAFIEHPES